MNSSKMLLIIFAIGLGIGYTMERATQDAPLLAYTPKPEPIWFQDLDPGYQKLLAVMRKKGYMVDENAVVCSQKDIFGHYTWGERTIKICTDRIAKSSNNSTVFRTFLQKTIAHEATHVAQSCRQRRSRKPSLELPATRLYGLPSSVRMNVQSALAGSRYSFPRSLSWRIEAEAFAMEDMPEQVIAALHAHCQ